MCDISKSSQTLFRSHKLTAEREPESSEIEGEQLSLHLKQREN